MHKHLVNFLKYGISLIVASGLLYFVFRNVDFADFMEKAKSVDYFWVILSIVISIISYLARAYRWNILMEPLGAFKLTTFSTTLAIAVGYLANLAFPRLGEITRCGMMKRSNDVPVSGSIGTVISERVIDMLTLLFMIFLTLIFEADVFFQFFKEEIKPYLSQDNLFKLLIFAIVGLILGGLVIMLIIKKAGPRIKEFVRQLIEGVISLRKIKNIYGFLISTIILWVTYYFMSYLIVFSLPETAHLSWVVGIMLLVTGGIALALPVQGGFGTYHTLISAMLALYAVDHTTGVFLATLLHTSQVVAIATFGSVSLLITFFLKKKSGIKQNPKGI